jgi:hypothetical protein
MNTFWLDTTGMIGCYDGTLPTLDSNPVYKSNPSDDSRIKCLAKGYYRCASTLNKEYNHTEVILPPFCNQNCPNFGFGAKFYSSFTYDAATPAIGMDYAGIYDSV